MPIEIRELVIRAVVERGDAQMPEREPEDGGSPHAAAFGDAGGTQAIVQECVRQVMRIVGQDKER